MKNSVLGVQLGVESWPFTTRAWRESNAGKQGNVVNKRMMPEMGQGK